MVQFATLNNQRVGLVGWIINRNHPSNPKQAIRWVVVWGYNPDMLEDIYIYIV